ncbi:RNA polymerase sigma-70 factor [Reichenbachiella agarivorans]|uniref:RNA polymerase sigma-70 factor n=1 Tax=Reichenbachiella agarivorans TaxID=2979464 RepID=A0ABY6CLH1_9BACT|nr:RNA polymerase sigma-70 factor [Reichenbachiella agarivorans]UXP31370.1 RNA polymerase sigma-70 factor [Reichenbachiella agarivorans]
MQISEEDILGRIASDDQGAFEQIFRLYYKDLSRYCLKYVRDEHVAEELVQEVFINIWDRRYSLKINTSVKAYLFTAVRNRSFNYIKLQIPKEQRKVDVDGMVDLSGSLSENREEELEFEELQVYVQNAIDSLPPKCQLIFNLSRNAGMSYKEIAEELDLSVKTVENQVGLALKKLRVQLHPIWDKVFVMIVLNFL